MGFLDDKTKHVFKINDGEKHWIIARNQYDAILVLASVYDMPESEIIDNLEEDIKQLPDDELLKVYQEEPFEDPSEYIETTCAEWVKGGGDIVASTCV